MEKNTEVPLDRSGENRGEISEALAHGTQEKSGYVTSDYRTHYLELDALRGIAITGVVIVHSNGVWEKRVGEPLNIPLLDTNLLDQTPLLTFVLTLFFMLSGYLLTWTEERRRRMGAYSARSYALRRIFRIVPAYYVALVMALLLWPTDKSAGDILAHFTFTQGFFLTETGFDGAYYSITPEVVFYAFLPLFILKIRSFSQRLILMVVLFAISLATEIYLINLYVNYNDWNFAHYLLRFPTTYLWMFIAGMVLRMVVERIQQSETFNFQPWHASVLFFTSLALFLGLPQTPFWGLPFTNAVMDLLVLLMFAGVIMGSPFVLSVLRWRPIVFVGVISYSMFLLHNSVLLLIRKLGIADMISPLAANASGFVVWASYAGFLGIIFAIAIPISYLSYRFIERPFLRIKPK